MSNFCLSVIILWLCFGRARIVFSLQEFPEFELNEFDDGDEFLDEPISSLRPNSETEQQQQQTTKNKLAETSPDRNESEWKENPLAKRVQVDKDKWGQSRQDDKDNKVTTRAPIIGQTFLADDDDEQVYVDRIMPDYFVLDTGIYSNCGVHYSCFSFPPECHLTKSCLVTMSYELQKDRLHVVLSGTSSSYLAVGFSQDDRMGDDAVVICRRSHSMDRLELWQAYNLQPQDRRTQFQNNSAVESHAGCYYKGVLTCDFSMVLTFVTKNGLKVDFLRKEYHILLAVGNDNKEPEGPGSITMHGFSLSSLDSVNLTSKVHRVLRQSTHRVISVHEVLAILTYGFFMPSAIFMARYGQQAFSFKYYKRNYPTWVIIHVTFHILGVITDVANFLTIYIGRAGTAFTTSSSFYHAVIGPIVFLGSMVNLVIGVVIHKIKVVDDKAYPAVLKWIHWAVGHLCYIFGVIEMLRGPYIRKSWLSCSFSVVVGLTFIFYVGSNVFLMFNTVYLRRKQELFAVSGFYSFFGPAIPLNIEADRKDYSIRRLTTYFLLLTLFICCVFLFVELGLSERTCDISCLDYI